MKKTAGRNILLVAAHPDDEVLGCGATIAKHTASGDRVWTVILGEGVTSRKNLSDNEKVDALKKLQVAAREAGQVLGVEKTILKDFPDNKFDSVPILDIVQSIEEIVDDLKPQVIYTHNPTDVNVDHRTAVEAVEAVARPGVKTYIDKVLSFEVPSSTEWNFTREPFRPNIFIELEKGQLEKKIEALGIYQDEVRPFPHPRSAEFVESLAKVRGGQGGFGLAEAFSLIYSRESK